MRNLHTGFARVAARLCLVAPALAAAAAGCDAGLAEAIDDVRSAAPSICKDYCEDVVTCEWPAADGEYEDDAFGAAIRRCTVDCAWFMVDGAYVSAVGTMGQKEFQDHLPGGEVKEALDCVFYTGAYRCSEESGFDVHVLDPPTESICNRAGACFGALGVDFHMAWDAVGSTCAVTGTQTVESVFF